ncbi:MAG: asparaginase domain-containing protein, partial [Actinomycetaceae bacterium]
MTVAVVTMGGTIATAITADGALPSETHAGALADLLAARGADARVVPFRNTSSRQVGAADMAALAAVILAEIADGASGIVVTH